MKLESAQELKQKILEMDEQRPVAQFNAISLHSFGLLGGGGFSFPTQAHESDEYGAAVSPAQTVAVGVSYSPQHQYRLALRAQTSSPSNERLAAFANELARGEVDLRIVGAVRQQMAWKRQRRRPPMIGCSISHINGTAGTLGCFVKDRQTDETLLLSNNHVIMCNDLANTGDPILQPGPADGGVAPGALIGAALRAVKLDARPGTRNLVDAALGSPEDGAALSAADKSLLIGLGRLSVTTPARALPGDRVAKLGRTTGVTWGTVVSADIDRLPVASAFDQRVFRFDNQIEIEGDDGQPFSLGGDSGSLVVNEGFEPVGMVFCGSDTGGAGAGLSYANHIDQVLDELGVDIVG